MKNNIVLNSLL